MIFEIMGESSQTPKKKTCFIISPIGDRDSETRKTSDQLIKYIIQPILDKYNYANAIRADHIEKPGMITTQIIDHILEDDLVIADLSDFNPNVFYELAGRHAFDKPVIQLMREGQEPPFDVSGLRTVFYDIHDLDRVDYLKKELDEYIKNIDSSKIVTPFSYTINYKDLSKSTNPRDTAVVQIIDGIKELNDKFQNLEREVYNLRFSRTIVQTVPAQELKPSWTSSGSIFTSGGIVTGSIPSGPPLKKVKAPWESAEEEKVK